ncbi:Threonyl/alanyl tRNA synthetase [Podospora aff. communis PSN243]|uniref:Threonyl/alanyl tRNA synthetase n=1 Tax=Podospora aff. communis PSN243 TaxID=3040156 RepID=A0AAV9H0Z5_9PEZI|nr:Threonyl/alanyl tRNA synthetase [Podospora aff. communis PSN243]
MSTIPARTILAFHTDAKLYKLETTVTSLIPFSSLEEANQSLFKTANLSSYVLITPTTIFHPQGGGQPSDEGIITKITSSGSETSQFTVTAVRTSATQDGQVLHLGHFPANHTSFSPGDTVLQSLDVEKRLLYSRLHTAGHVLGAAVRHLLESEIPGFDELKASHFPDSAACEFRGLIEGKWKEPIQNRVDEYLARGMPVEIDFWDEEDFRRNGLERLIPDRSLLPEGEKFRVVKIVGAETYPCGGTHVERTDLCGETKVRKISRGKGVSRVSYAVV